MSAPSRGTRGATTRSLNIPAGVAVPVVSSKFSSALTNAANGSERNSRSAGGVTRAIRSYPVAGSRRPVRRSENRFSGP